MEAPQQTETAPPTPEQLLKLLDLQLGQERSKRQRRGRKRATSLATAIFFIIVAAGIALLVAQHLLVGFHERGALRPLSAESFEE